MMPGKAIWKFTIFIMGVVAGLALLLPIVMLQSTRPQSPAVELVDNTYITGVYCPNERVEYLLHWNIHRPSVLVITSTHRRAGGDTIQGQRAGNRFITNIPESGSIIDIDAGFDVPNFMPGEYEYVLSVGTESEDSDPVFVRFPYTISDDCFD